MFNNELWRIIGVFDGRLKIVRTSSYTTSTYLTTWINFPSITMENSLISGYYSALSTNWKRMVDSSHSYRSLGNLYNITISSRDTMSLTGSYVTPISLPSIVDLAYATSGVNCNTNPKGWYNGDECLGASYNWLNALIGGSWLVEGEWSGNGTGWMVYAYAVSGSLKKIEIGQWINCQMEAGSTGASVQYWSNKAKYSAFPVLYLLPDVQISSGSGTQSNPYQLYMN